MPTQVGARDAAAKIRFAVCNHALSSERKLRMRVLLAGASGAIGMPLIGRLRTAGHDVLAIHRSPAGRAKLAAAGAMPVQADVLGPGSAAPRAGGPGA